MPDNIEAPPASVDISSELYRVYTYANGDKFRINNPVSLFLLDGGDSHRVIDAAGVTHRPTRGWVGLSWKPKPGEKAFDF